MKLILLEVGVIGSPRFAVTVLRQWPCAHATLYLGIKDYLEMEIETLQTEHRERVTLIKQRVIVVFNAATEVLDEELRQDLQLWAEAVFPFLKNLGKLTCTKNL